MSQATCEKAAARVDRNTVKHLTLYRKKPTDQKLHSHLAVVNVSLDQIIPRQCIHHTRDVRIQKNLKAIRMDLGCSTVTIYSIRT